MLKQRRQRLQPRLELAPLIDIVFILLIFFAVSTTLIIQKQGMKLTLPEANTVTQEKKGVTLSVSQDNRLFLNDIALEHEKLRSTIAGLLGQDAQLQVIIKAHVDTPYVHVIKLLDEIRLAGCFDVVLEAKKLR